MANHTQADEEAASVEQESDAVEITADEELNEAAAEILDVGQQLFMQTEAFLSSLLRPWNAYQVGIALALFVVAHCLRLWLGPKIRAWMASREGWPKWRMRVLVVVHQRLRAIFFVLLMWLTVTVMQEVTWNSRSYLLGVMASLATAWLLVAFATRLIRSSFLRQFVRYGAWAYVTLYLLGIVDEATRILDAAALSIGDIRISLLLIVQGVVIIGLLLTLARFITSTTSRRVQSNEDISPSMRVLIVKVVQIVFYALAFFMGVRALGIDLTGLAVLSGAIGVGLGFGLQKVVSNLVSGVIILLD